MSSKYNFTHHANYQMYTIWLHSIYFQLCNSKNSHMTHNFPKLKRDFKKGGEGKFTHIHTHKQH